MFWAGDKSDEKNENDLVSENSETLNNDSDSLFNSIIESNNSNSAVEEVALNSEEEITSDEEESSSEEEYEEEEDQLNQIKQQIEILKREKLEFFSDTRKVFLEEWLYANGNWLSELSIEHLDFLRDILGIEKNYSSWPAPNQ